MKNTFIALVAWIAVSCASCQKEYTCVCTEGWFVKTSSESTVKASNRDNAVDKCKNKVDLGGALTGKSCDLK